MRYILLHGWGGSKQSMEPLAQLLREKGCEATSLDLPGFGTEPNPPQDWGVGEYADFVERKILNPFNLAQGGQAQAFGSEAQDRRDDRAERITLIGHSFGGAIALKIASKNPKWLAKIVVLAPSWKREMQESRIKNQEWRRRIKNLLPNSVKKMIYRLFFRKSDLYLRVDLESNYRKIITQDLTGEVKKITVATLILWGDQDTYVPVSQGSELHQLIHNSSFMILPAGRHGLPFRNPLWVIEKMREKRFV